VKLADINPGKLLVDIAHAAFQKIRNRPKAVARRAAKAARKAPRQRQPDEAAGEFFQTDEVREMLQGKLTHTGAGIAASSPFVGLVVNAFVPHIETKIIELGVAPFMCAAEATNCITAGQLAFGLVSGAVALIGSAVVSFGRKRAEKRHAAELAAAAQAAGK
jgi:hypothetical protein